MFSHRTNWHRQHNKLTELLEVRRKTGKPIYDLTISNPTECGFDYPEKEILSALSNANALQYKPDPRGLLTAREAVAQYYRTKGVAINPSQVFLTSSTSEAYSLLFKLLCNTNDTVLIPNPSYPLFDYLAQINDVKTEQYELIYDHGWQIDLDALARTVSDSTKAIVLINPHNPTGMFLKKNDFKEIQKIARDKNIALIVDEVFIDYQFDENSNSYGSTAGNSDVMTFTLNGISKMCGFPQMKLGWIVVNGHSSAVNEAVGRLEILCDTFLSVNTPVQTALPKLLLVGESVRKQILQRVTANYETLRNLVTPRSSCSLLAAEGGWYGIIRVPQTKSDETWALELLDKHGVYLYPGYFFDFEGYLVVSLLTKREEFQATMKSIVEFINV